jgi:hypothetical protein
VVAVLFRINADGTLDSGFGAGGQVINQSVNLSDQHESTAVVLPNGDLVIGGLRLVSWYDSKGNQISTRTDVPGDVSTVGIAPNGDLFAGGQGGNSYPGNFPTQGPGAFVIRYLSLPYLSPGILDTAFGSGGVATWSAPAGQSTNASVTVLANGQALATQTIFGSNGPILARFKTPLIALNGLTAAITYLFSPIKSKTLPSLCVPKLQVA